MPVGAEIIISVHSDINVVEKGPLQLVNSWAPVVVSGARGVLTEDHHGQEAPPRMPWNDSPSTQTSSPSVQVSPSLT